MKDKIFIGIIGGISIIASSIPIYNYYIIPAIRHKEMMDRHKEMMDRHKEMVDKIYGFDKRLKKLEK
jgi:hypothetical protein